MSFFEVLTGMMFAAFADAPVDVAVIEVGLGGRWDATNVADGAVAVIRPIAMDHMQWLGDTIEAIATEKAGIIKPGAIAIIAQQQRRGRGDPAGAGRARSARPWPARGFEFGVLAREMAVGGQQLVLQGLRGTYGGCVPAAVRRVPGVQRGVRAGGRRGVRRRSRRPLPNEDGSHVTLGPGLSGEGLDPDLVRAGFAKVELARPARDPAAQPDGHRGRGAQPGGDGGDAAGAAPRLPLHPGDRGRRGREDKDVAGVLDELEPVLSRSW